MWIILLFWGLLGTLLVFIWQSDKLFVGFSPWCAMLGSSSFPPLWVIGIGIMIVQWPIYGYVIYWASQRKKGILAAGCILLLHVLAAFFVYYWF